MTPPAFNRLRSFFVVIQQDSERLCQDVIKKVFNQRLLLEAIQGIGEEKSQFGLHSLLSLRCCL
ncbi:hypothetical protein DPMN_069173 [Dreissena polymorpha]|uniref:Uncharacterized protein n=1 Tax=Dreissena polymorpha TaxID=45954 RepID=A0A9D3YYL2_DREPO|nr:hypothetical protein DPMN_069173 [Dreissena polymorpha]